MVGQISVGSMRGSYKPLDGWIDVRCDRASILGNPFDLKNESQRPGVCTANEEWLEANIRAFRSGKDIQVSLSPWLNQGFSLAPKFKNPTSRQISSELMRIYRLVESGQNVRLMCWCKPNQCHCDAIALKIQQKLGTRKLNA
jgi:hypothetical protein